MGLKSKATSATIKFDGNTLKLSARFANLEKLKELTGQEPFGYIGAALDLSNPDDCVNKLTNMFLCLQDEPRDYTEEEIRDAFFGNFAAFFSEEPLIETARVIGHILGQDISEKLAEAQKAMATAEPEKKD